MNVQQMHRDGILIGISKSVPLIGAVNIFFNYIKAVRTWGEGSEAGTVI